MIPDINLLPKREKRSTTGNWFLILFGVLFIVALLFMVVQYVLFSSKIGALESEEAQLKVDKEVLEEEVVALREAKKDDLATSVQFVESISYPVSPLIREFNRYLDDHAYLRNYSFREDKVAFTVDFETIADVSLYIDDLLKSPYIKDVIVNGMNTFDPASSIEGDQFKVLDRYMNTFEVLIDLRYLKEEMDGER